MTILSMRELLQFPPGDNETDTLINGVHFNTTTLNYFNYTLYSNGTLSNGSKCWLTFDIYKPLLLSNGTFINGTSCYVPIKGLKARGSIGIAFAALFAATLFLSFIIVIALAGISVAFNIASSFIWQISPLKYDGNPGYLYGLGYGPPLVIVTILNIFAYLESNEDRELIRQRIQRGRANDTELGIEAGRRKPAWWRRLRPDFKGDVGNSYEARLRALTTEVGGGRPTQRNIEQRVEMGVIDTNRYRDSVDSHTQSNTDPFTDDHRHPPNPQSTGSEPTEAPVEPGPRTGRLHSSAASQFSQSSGETLVSQARNQPRVRSMLDV
ncbi:hypothetical protein TEQG_00927 [Trichophyton equinum CBS 127.97]|uniref:Uncharacterized protein n=1 Tax=Trichophyton equinum (strain ATCC MYA-4606 / CBS 127.97) TaxID=559882 RepID=F2PJ18_TRIEC|nr:hypothetical protein TEQG_00927 [Trichophyton equinum CBS 127.97]